MKKPTWPREKVSEGTGSRLAAQDGGSYALLERKLPINELTQVVPAGASILAQLEQLGDRMKVKMLEGIPDRCRFISSIIKKR